MRRTGNGATCVKMKEDASERKPGSTRPAKKSAAALSAALRANLQRRKARERALRAKPDSARESAPQAGGEDAPDENHEATWTK